MGKGSHYCKLVHPELPLPVGFCTKFKYAFIFQQLYTYAKAHTHQEFQYIRNNNLTPSALVV